MNAERARVVITGADGFIGSHLTPRLRASGLQVQRVVRTPTEPHDVAADLRDPLPPQTIEQGDIIVHLAAIAHRGASPKEHEDVTHRAAVRVGRLAAARGASQLIFMSSAKVYGDHGDEPFTVESELRPADSYSSAKVAAERALEDLAGPMSVALIRSPLVYGPGARGNVARMARAIGRGIPLPMSKPAPMQSVVEVTRLANAIELILRHPAAAVSWYQPSDHAPIALDAFATAVGQGMGRSARPFGVPPKLFEVGAGLSRRAGFGSLTPLYRDFVLAPDRELEAIGWSPCTDTATQVARAVSMTDFDTVR